MSLSSHRRLRIIVNVVALQVTWFAAVLGAARGWWWLGVVVLLPMLIWHVVSSSQPTAEFFRVMMAGVIGGSGDSVLTASGLLRVAGGGAGGYLTSAWMIALWIAFATSLTLSMRFLERWRWWQVAGIGALSAAFSYYGGARLGAVTFPYGALVGLLGVAALWALAMPVLVAQARKNSNA